MLKLGRKADRATRLAQGLALWEATQHMGRRYDLGPRAHGV